MSQQAISYIKANVHSDVDFSEDELPGLVGNPWATRFAMKCPSCGNVSEEFDWVADAIETNWARLSEDRDAIRPVAPCCDAPVSIFDLTFPCPWADERPAQPDWRLYEVAGFSRFAITLTNRDAPVEKDHLRAVEAIIGCPMKLIYYVL
jgi:hypothetical protein